MAIIVIASILAFARALNGGFLFDDPAIYDMEWNLIHWNTGTFLGDLRSLWLSPRHLTHLGYRWTWQLKGFTPWAWHSVNLAIHAACVVLLYLALLPILGERAALAAFAFGVHPHQAASVCYISGRAAIQATFFTLCALVLIQQGHYGMALLSEVFAWKSKQDAPIYALLFPVYWLLLR